MDLVLFFRSFFIQKLNAFGSVATYRMMLIKPTRECGMSYYLSLSIYKLFLDHSRFQKSQESLEITAPISAAD